MSDFEMPKTEKAHKKEGSLAAATVVAHAPAAAKEMSDKEVWLRIYCAVISSNVNATAQARAIADRGLAEFKEVHGIK